MSSPFAAPQRSRGRGGRNGHRGRGNFRNNEIVERSNVWGSQQYQNGANNGHSRPYARETVAPRMPPQKEGNITDPEGLPRRIFVRNIPPHTTLKDLRDFFGQEKVEALYSDGRVAHVQFKLPSQATKAVTRNGEKLLGKSIRIEEFNDTKPRSKPAETYSSMDIIRDIEQSRRIRTGMPERSRSNSGSSISSLGDNTDQQRMENPPDVPPPPAPPQIKPTEWSSMLPSNIDLTLRLVITDKTARKLSVPQLENLVKYFSEEREFVLNNKQIEQQQQQQQRAKIHSEPPPTCSNNQDNNESANDVNFDALFDPF